MDDIIERRWIILLREGRVPEVKRPVNTDQGMLEMLEYFYNLFPTAKALSVSVTWDGQLWVRDGQEELKIGGNNDSETL